MSNTAPSPLSAGAYFSWKTRQFGQYIPPQCGDEFGYFVPDYAFRMSEAEAQATLAQIYRIDWLGVEATAVQILDGSGDVVVLPPGWTDRMLDDPNFRLTPTEQVERLKPVNPKPDGSVEEMTRRHREAGLPAPPNAPEALSTTPPPLRRNCATCLHAGPFTCDLMGSMRSEALAWRNTNTTGTGCPGWEEAVVRVTVIKAPTFEGLAELRAGGFLQELNRLVLHPAGLALGLVESDDGQVVDVVVKRTDDPTGWAFLPADEGLEDFKAKAASVAAAILERRDGRLRDPDLGAVIEPVPGNDPRWETVVGHTSGVLPHLHSIQLDDPALFGAVSKAIEGRDAEAVAEVVAGFRLSDEQATDLLRAIVIVNGERAAGCFLNTAGRLRLMGSLSEVRADLLPELARDVGADRCDASGDCDGCGDGDGYPQ